MRLLASLLLLLSLASTPALTQSSPGLVFGQVPTAEQWNSFFSVKQDVLGYSPVNKAGDTMTGRFVTSASSASGAGFRLPHGVAPTTPGNGDLWTTTAGIYARINGATVGPLVDTTPSGVNAVEFGMSTGGTAAANATALSAACAASATVYIPAGSYDLGAPTLTGCSRIYGDGPGKTILVAAGTPVTALLFFNGNTTVIIENLEININLGTFPTTNGIQCVGSSSCVIRNVLAQGNIPIYCNTVSNCLVENSKVTSYGTYGIYAVSGSSAKFSHNSVSGPGGSAVHGLVCESNSYCEMSFNRATNARIFNYEFTDTSEFLAVGNVSTNSIHEGLNVTAMSAAVAKGVIANNILEFNATSLDYCMSLAGTATFAITAVEIVNNICHSSAKEAVTLAVNVRYSKVSGNTLISPNALNLSGTGAGILLQGVNTTNNLISDNTFSDLTGFMQYQIREFTDGTGSPNTNTLGPNYGSKGSVAPFLVVGAATQTIDLTDCTANKVVAGPTSGATIALACRALIVGDITGLGTGVATALGVNVGSAGAFMTFNGALGTPSSGTVTNLTGTASININGTVGATTPTTGVFTAVTATSFNGLIITPSAGTLTVANNASASLITSGNFALTLTSMATTNATFPAGTGTFAYIAGTNSWSGVNTFTNATASTSTSTGAVVISGGLGVGGKIFAAAINVAGGAVGATGGISIGGNRAMTQDSGFTSFYDGNGTNLVFEGGPTGLFFSQTTHTFRGQAGGATMVTIDATSLILSQTTDATSVSTGAFRVPGGVSINKRVWMDGLTAASGTPTAICRNANEITVNAAVTCTVSSLDFKHDFRPIEESACSKLRAMRPGSFFYNDNHNRQRLGFVAEYMARVDRRLADGWDKDDHPRSIDQNAILAIVVKCSQEQIATNDNLRADIDQLKRRVAR